MRTLADAYILEGDSEAIGQQLRALLKAGVGRRGSSILEGVPRGDPVRRPSTADPMNRGINRYHPPRYDEIVSIVCSARAQFATKC